MTPRRELTGALCALACVLLAACGATAEGGNTTAVSSIPTVPNVGALPAPLATTTTSVPETTADTAPASSEPIEEAEPFGAEGNRILMLGDSILASTSKRYSNTMCDALEPLGWAVRIEAEVSRPIQFGVEVMRQIGDQDWDAGLVFLGTNYGDDANEYLKQINRIIVAFGDVPVVLVTISEYRAEIRDVNATIEALTEVYDNVSVLDWRAITAERPEILWEDRIHPTTEGREILAAAVAEHLGAAPAGSEGDCLDQTYTDDSEGTIDGRPSGSSSGGNRPTASTTTTVRPSTVTTVRPSGSTTTVPNTSPTTTTGTGGSGSSTTVPSATTTPSQTVPPTSPPTMPTTPATVASTVATTPPSVGP